MLSPDKRVILKGKLKMADYISSFTTGFDEIIEQYLPIDLPGSKVISIYDGLVYFKYSGDYNHIKRIVYLNNTFGVIKAFKGEHLTFDMMISVVAKAKYKYFIKSGSYRIRFSQENKFVKVDKRNILIAEKKISQLTNLKVDRLNPSTEIWYMIRSEGVGFYAQLLFKRKATEKKLNKGELRPEFSHLMCCCAKIGYDDIVCDPFCGFGSIPKQLFDNFKCKKIYASDVDGEKIEQLKRGRFKNQDSISLVVEDARHLKHICDNSVDAVITDPPWGFFENIDNICSFYSEMLDELLRITKKRGKIVLLTARKDEIIHVCDIKNVAISRQINTLVNGKKAAVFIIDR